MMEHLENVKLDYLPILEEDTKKKQKKEKTTRKSKRKLIWSNTCNS